MKEIPRGFEQLTTKSPFTEMNGPFYLKKTGNGFIFGMRIQSKHCNIRNNAHGGLISTFADVALGYSIISAGDPPLKIVTVSLTTDFIDSAKLGDWLEADVVFRKIGKKLAFADAHIHVNDRSIAGSKGIFSIISK
jgi:acyl-coenzyme A thioesterase 13